MKGAAETPKTTPLSVSLCVNIASAHISQVLALWAGDRDKCHLTGRGKVCYSYM